jgi:hypothetical protein
LHVVAGFEDRGGAVAAIDASGADLVAQREPEIRCGRLRRDRALTVDHGRTGEPRLVDEPDDELERAARILGHALGVVDDQAEELLVEAAVLEVVRRDQLVERVMAHGAVREQRAQPLQLGLQLGDLLAQAGELVVGRVGGLRLGLCAS